MEKILVGVDFSESSLNAAKYAVKFASFFSAKILLINAYSMPIPYAEAGAIFETEDFEKTAINELQKVKEDLLKTAPQININTIVKQGTGEDVICDELNKNKYDLIILGINPDINGLYEYFIGSTATSLARIVNVPVLIVPKNCNFHKFFKIGYAANFNKDFSNSNNLIYLKYFANIFDAQFLLINVITNNDMYNVDVIHHENFIKDYLQQSHPKIVYTSNKDVAQGLINTVNQKGIDLLITSPEKHHFFYEWYHESNTKKLAFHCNSPLLCLPLNS